MTSPPLGSDQAPQDDYAQRLLEEADTAVSQQDVGSAGVVREDLVVVPGVAVGRSGIGDWRPRLHFHRLGDTCC